ncbi:MAG: hypothetical protein KBC84_09230 [Proteobacteria bacterium]|nr:hypothetical protein [Pseudomonadota bacterium]
MIDDLEQEGTPEDTADSEISEEDLSNLSLEDLDLIIEGTPDEENAETPTQPDSQQDDVASEELIEGSEPTKPQKTIEDYQRELDDQRKFNERRSSELGQLKLEFRKVIAEKEELIKKLEYDSPVEAMRAEKELERLKEDQEAIESEDIRIANESRFLATVPKHVKREEFDVNAIKEELLMDGAKPEHVENFMRNISQQDPALVINMAKRAYYASALKKLVPITQALLKEKETWGKKSATQGERIARSISQELKRPKTLTSGRPTPKAVSENIDVTRLSLKELDELIKG